MAETREMRKTIIMSSIEAFLDHLEDDFDEEAELGSIVICGEVYQESSTIPTYYSSNENGIWRRGFFECLTDYLRIPPTEEDDDDD